MYKFGVQFLEGSFAYLPDFVLMDYVSVYILKIYLTKKNLKEKKVENESMLKLCTKENEKKYQCTRQRQILKQTYRSILCCFHLWH